MEHGTKTASGASWHRCRRWWEEGFRCPFKREEEEEDDDDDEDDIPEEGIIPREARFTKPALVPETAKRAQEALAPVERVLHPDFVPGEAKGSLRPPPRPGLNDPVPAPRVPDYIPPLEPDLPGYPTPPKVPAREPVLRSSWQKWMEVGEGLIDPEDRAPTVWRQPGPIDPQDLLGGRSGLRVPSGPTKLAEAPQRAVWTGGKGQSPIPPRIAREMLPAGVVPSWDEALVVAESEPKYASVPPVLGVPAAPPKGFEGSWEEYAGPAAAAAGVGGMMLMIHRMARGPRGKALMARGESRLAGLMGRGKPAGRPGRGRGGYGGLHVNMAQWLRTQLGQAR